MTTTTTDIRAAYAVISIRPAPAGLVASATVTSTEGERPGNFPAECRVIEGRRSTHRRPCRMVAPPATVAVCLLREVGGRYEEAVVPAGPFLPLIEAALASGNGGGHEAWGAPVPATTEQLAAFDAARAAKAVADRKARRENAIDDHDHLIGGLNGD